MKLDVKSILLIGLSALVLLFFSLWFFKGSDTKDRIKDLEKENKKIESVRDSLETVNESLKLDFIELESLSNNKDLRLKEMEKQLELVKKDLIDANKKVSDYKKDLSETKKQIESLKNDPIKREGDDLINSLKEKLK